MNRNQDGNAKIMLLFSTIIIAIVMASVYWTTAPILQQLSSILVRR